MKKMIFTFGIAALIFLGNFEAFAQHGYCGVPQNKTQVVVQYSEHYYPGDVYNRQYAYNNYYEHHHPSYHSYTYSCNMCHGHGQKVRYHKPKQVRYVYYSDYNMYYDHQRRVYIYLDGPYWRASAHLPVYVNARQLSNARTEYYNWKTNEPYKVHRHQRNGRRSYQRRN